ncbi:MAG TPA: ABC-three component system protein [Cellvibrio sp.]|nr:ABC-three component system protein [Cellvibrio sp.]
MADFIQKARKHCVTVDNGSGVLIQPSEGEYSYVITAKHVIEVAMASNTFREPKDISVLNFEKLPIEVVAVHVDETFDLAVLITKTKLDISLQPSISRISRNDVVYFYGFAQTRRDKNPEDYLREYEGTIKENESKKFVVKLEDRPAWDEVVGASGGGIFVSIEDDIFLAGIETRMEGDTSAEYHGRVVCLPISVLEDLLIKESLPLIYPEAMNTFLNLVSQTFDYYDQADDPKNLRFLKSKLREHATNISNDSTVRPVDLMKKFERALLISNSSLQDLYSVDLWVAYLEFIVISSLIDEAGTLDFSYVHTNCTKRRFLFSASKDNWVWRLMDIFHSDFRGLAPGGIIVISSGDKTGTLTAKRQMMENVVINIGQTDRELMVDSAIVNPAKEYTVFHLNGLHKVCALDKEFDFAKYYAGNEGFDVRELMEKIRGEYREYL